MIWYLIPLVFSFSMLSAMDNPPPLLEESKIIPIFIHKNPDYVQEKLGLIYECMGHKRNALACYDVAFNMLYDHFFNSETEFSESESSFIEKKLNDLSDRARSLEDLEI